MSRWIAGGRAASAYEVAVANGYVGTEQQWLASLQSNVTPEAVAANLPARLSDAELRATSVAAAADDIDDQSTALGLAAAKVFAPKGAGLKLYGPSKGTATFQTLSGTAPLPGWLSADGKRLFSYYSQTLRDSLDGGATWRVVRVFTPEHFVQGVREMANGELLVTTSLDGASTTGGEVWISAGYNRGVGGPAATWTKTVQMDDGANAVNPFSISPPLHHLEDLPAGVNLGIMVIGEYGNQAKLPRKVYVTEDYGLTWRTIYNPTGVANPYHHHGVAYDPWGDAVWISTGDGATNRSVRYSTDWRAATPTWTIVPVVTEQPVGMWPMTDCILMGSDNAPNGVHRVDRIGSGANYDPVIRTPFRLNTSTSQRNLAQTFYKRPGGPLIIPFTAVRGSAEKRGFILATWNGQDFFELWREPTPYVDTTFPVGDYGVYTAVGPTVQGKILGHMRRDQPFWPNVEQQFVLPEPSWSVAKVTPRPFPSHVEVPVFQTPVTSSLWSSTPLITSTTWRGMSIQASAQNAQATWEVDMGAGVHTLDLLHRVGPAVGNLHVLIDGVEVAVVDGYAAALTARATSVPNIAVATSNTKRVTIKIATKNASSTGYEMYLSGLSFTRLSELL